MAEFGLGDRAVLEVGSLNVNGSTRRFFTGEYVGVDMRPGPGVDQVVNAHDLGDHDLPESGYDAIVCTEMLEHDDAPWVSVREMYAICNTGGYLLLTCRGYDRRGCFPLHEYPHDLWRFSCGGVEALLTAAGWVPVLIEQDPDAPGVFAVATKED